MISGPSGSGKTTLLARVLKDKSLAQKIKRSISFTTRPRRSQEKDGRDYFFITPGEFKVRLGSKKILEWTRYLGYYYGTPRDFLERQLRQGKHLALCLDLKGALKIKRAYPQNTTLIFVLPPSVVELRQRIKKRCQHTTSTEIRRRLQLADAEIAAGGRYDYQLLNRNLSQATRKLIAIIRREMRTSNKEGRKNGLCAAGKNFR